MPKAKRSSLLYYGIISALAVIVLGSCAAPHAALTQLNPDSGYCSPTTNYAYGSETLPLDSVTMLAYIPINKKYSQHSLMVANAAGVLKDLKDLDNETPQSVESLQKQQVILGKLMLVSTEIASIAAELDCEGERADQTADFLTQKESQRVKNLTVLSIAVGALAGIGNAVFPHGAAVASAVVGGSLSAGLGLSALFSGRKVTYNHSRNLLADFWNEPGSSKVFPPAIWYMLNEKYFSNSQKISVLQNMKQRWIALQGLDRKTKDGQRRIILLFGSGGAYSDDDLRLRAALEDQVQAAVRLMSQDLQGLIAETIKK